MVLNLRLPLTGAHEPLRQAAQIVLERLDSRSHGYHGPGAKPTVGQLPGQRKVVPNPAHYNDNISLGDP